MQPQLATKQTMLYTVGTTVTKAYLWEPHLLRYKVPCITGSDIRKNCTFDTERPAQLLL